MTLPFWAYILRCSDDSCYTGHTDLLEMRVAQHQAGQGAAHTQQRRPLTLVWCHEFPARLEALEAERQIKGWRRAKKEALIAGDWSLLSELSRTAQTAGRPSTSSGRTVRGAAAFPPSREPA